jgi:iron complex outermembrane recepter protein
MRVAGMEFYLKAGVASLALMTASQALAQTEEAEAEPSDATALEGPVDPATTSNEQITVTGTRLRTGYNLPTPTTVVSADQLSVASPLLTESLNQLPVFKNSSRPQNASTSSVRDNAASFLNLRGLGPQKTLVLLDGRRVVASSSSGAPDINLFPQDLISRIEVVTGGASAAYGSDAVTGVVNFILDRKFSGARASGQVGISEYGDGGSRQGALTFGTAFGGGRGHFLASAEYFGQDQIDPPGGRDWASNSCQIIGNPTPPPLRLIACNVNLTNATFGGVITTGPLANTQFLRGGRSAPFVRGTSVSGTTMIGGDGARIDQSLSAGVERWSVFSRGEFEVQDNLTVFLEGAVASSTARFDQRPPQNLAGNNFTIFNDNAFLPADIRARMGTATSISVGRLNRDWGWINAVSTSDTYRATGGLEWQLSDKWDVQAYAMHGVNNYVVDTQNNQIWRRTYAAADAVRDPAGNIVCRSTLAGLDTGCVPLNIFGEGSASPEALRWILGTASSELELVQDVASVVLRGEVPALPAGPISVAGGVEYRRERADQTSDAVSQVVNTNTGLRGFPAGLVGSLGGFELANPQPLSGGYNVREGFFEVEVPLLRDVPLASLLSVNGAVRLIDYSTVGSVFTWKAGVSYSPFADLKLRATRSRDIRAANINELYSPAVNTGGFVFVNNVSTRWSGKRSGNPALEPEVADTTTVGIVYRPSWLTGVGFSVDFYDIALEGAISQLTAQQTIDACAAGSAIACSVISADPAGGLVIDSPTLNLSEVKARGVDLEATYTTSLGAGRLGFRFLASYLDKLETTTPGAPAIDRAGDIGISGTPRWSGNLQLTYTRGDWDVFVQERYTGAGKVDSVAAPNLLADNTVGAQWYTDFTIRRRLDGWGGKLQLFATVNNVFGNEPPIVPTSPYGTFRATNFSLYDVYGRYMTVGARLGF